MCLESAVHASPLASLVRPSFSMRLEVPSGWGSSMYSLPGGAAGSRQLLFIDPTQNRPAGSHLPSLNLIRSH